MLAGPCRIFSERNSVRAPPAKGRKLLNNDRLGPIGRSCLRHLRRSFGCSADSGDSSRDKQRGIGGCVGACSVPYAIRSCPADNAAKMQPIVARSRPNLSRSRRNLRSRPRRTKPVVRRGARRRLCHRNLRLGAAEAPNRPCHGSVPVISAISLRASSSVTMISVPAFLTTLAFLS